MAGYSRKPLFDKLNLKPHFRVAVVNPPSALRAELARLNAPPKELDAASNSSSIDAALIFAVDPAPLEHAIAAVLPRIADGGLIWLCWPKKTSGIPATLTEADVHRIGLTTGWVDVKVCAIDEKWSGLKLVRRRKEL